MKRFIPDLTPNKAPNPNDGVEVVTNVIIDVVDPLLITTVQEHRTAEQLVVGWGGVVVGGGEWVVMVVGWGGSGRW